MIYLAVIAVILFGIFYAVRPELFLRRKHGDTPPPLAVRTARFMGFVMVLVGGGWLILLLSTT